MTNTQKIAAGVLAVCAVLGTLAFFGLTPFKAVNQVVQQFGSVVQSDVPWFTNGYKVGNSNALFTSSSMSIPAGSDQIVWQNLTGQAVIVDNVHVDTNGTSSTAIASSTYMFSVGATSTATIAEPYKFNWITSVLTPLAITNFMLSTGTPVGYAAGGLTFRNQADNFAYHASSTPGLNTTATIVVPPNWYLFAKIDTNCITQGACDTSTSTTRGFTTVSIPFWYHYSSPN